MIRHIIIRDNGAGMEEAALYKMKEDISAILKRQYYREALWKRMII